MIYLNCEVKSGLGEDTFWTWFHREFPSSVFDIPKKMKSEDILFRYSTLGFLPIEGKQVSLCWELYPEMKKYFHSNQWDSVIENVELSARYSTYRTVATQYTVDIYQKFGSVEVIPIAVNTDLYKPLNKKNIFRKKYQIPIDKKVGFWIGTNHPMKGFSNLIKYANSHLDVHWILVWKSEGESIQYTNANSFIKIPQSQIAELMNASDFFLSTSNLVPYYMAEWEAMACDLPFVSATNVKREFELTSDTRNKVFELGWDRHSAKKKWVKFLKDRGIKW